MIYHHLSNETLNKIQNIYLKGFCRKFLVFFVLNIAFLNAYDFHKCKEFYINTSQIFSLQNGKQIRAIHIGNGKYIAFSKENSNDSIKYDNFTHLILFKGKNIAQKYDLISYKNHKIPSQLAAITTESITKGRILQNGKSLKINAIFSQQIPINAVISDICYQAYGIGIGGDSFIDSAYMERFLRYESIYSDIGFSVKVMKNTLLVESINPFMSAISQENLRLNPTKTTTESLKIGDEILAINGRNIKSEYDFFDISSTLDIAKTALITAKRNGKIIKITIQPFKRERAFDDKGTVLDFFGIILDDNLIVQKSPNIFKPKDKILRINQIKVSNKFQLDSAISAVFAKKDDFSFLILRDDFEFFITIPNKRVIFE